MFLTSRPDIWLFRLIDAGTKPKARAQQNERV